MTLRGRVFDEVRALLAEAKEGRLAASEVLARISPQALKTALAPALPPLDALAERGIFPIVRGVAACAGVGTGRIRFTATDVVQAATGGDSIVFVRPETNAEDVLGIRAARALLTASGGLTSHAAVMARGIGRTCVVGCGDLRIDEKKRECAVIDGETGATKLVLREGDEITVDGSTGQVFLGAVRAVAAGSFPELRTILEWADESRGLRVHAAASNQEEAAAAREAGADEIGLCRVEQTWSTPASIRNLRRVFFSSSPDAKTEALRELGAALSDELRRMHESSKPITVRLFDSPIAEYSPRNDAELASMANEIGSSADALRYAVADCAERWPAFGRRGARLLLSDEAFLLAQLSAIEAAAATAGVAARVLVPFVTYAEEVAHVRSHALPTTEIGAMIETPRACLVANDIAKHATFVAVGFNDLTQSTLAMGRDDAQRWFAGYGVGASGNPFAVVDEKGVGALLRIAVAAARAARPTIDVFFCGEACADESAIELAKELGASAVTVGPGNIPFLRLFLGHFAAKHRPMDKK